MRRDPKRLRSVIEAHSHCIFYCYMIEYNIRPLEDKDRRTLQEFIRQFWHSDTMVSRGRVHHPAEQAGFVAETGEAVIGLITYAQTDREMEITLLDSRERSQGIGTQLVAAVVAEARKRRCERLWLIATNDNIRAIHFYQKRGFDLVKLHYDSVKNSRKLKPGIPETGFAGIPIRHELEFEWKED